MSVLVMEQMELPFPTGILGLKADVLDLAERRDVQGVTVAEVRTIFEVHHGRASAALSTLHRYGLLDRLAERRDRCSVYVIPDAVEGREIRPYGRRKPPVEVPLEVLGEERARARRSALLEVAGFVGPLRQTILTGSPSPKTHSNGCYTTHPECALRAVLRFIAAREAGE